MKNVKKKGKPWGTFFLLILAYYKGTVIKSRSSVLYVGKRVISQIASEYVYCYNILFEKQYVYCCNFLFGKQLGKYLLKLKIHILCGSAILLGIFLTEIKA